MSDHSESHGSKVKIWYLAPAIATWVDALSLYKSGNVPMTKVVTDFVSGIISNVWKILGKSTPNLPTSDSVDLTLARNNHDIGYTMWLLSLWVWAYGVKKFREGKKVLGGTLVGAGTLWVVEATSVISNSKFLITSTVSNAIKWTSDAVSWIVPNTTSASSFFEFLSMNPNFSAVLYAALFLYLYNKSGAPHPFRSSWENSGENHK